VVGGGWAGACLQKCIGQSAAGAVSRCLNPGRLHVRRLAYDEPANKENFLV
jgi:hypothetical protein